MDASPAPPTPIRSLALALVLALGLSAGAVAQPTVSVRGNVGASFFRSPDFASETLHSGVDLGLEAGVRIYEGWGVTLRGGYDQFTLNEESLRAFSQGGELPPQGDISFLSGGLAARYTYLNDSDAHPYASMGVGVYRLRSANRKVFRNGEIVGREGDATETKLGLHLALGSLFRLDETYAVFFEPRYVFYDLGESIAGNVRYFTLRLGVDVQLN
jgi:opacity protein-like surface antigen